MTDKPCPPFHPDVRFRASRGASQAEAKLGIEFEEVPILLFTKGYKEELLRYSPAGKVPIYIEDELVVWDTLAIAEYLAETYPTLWSSNVKQRAEARSISAEMHSGFFALRGSMPMNCRAKGR